MQFSAIKVSNLVSGNRAICLSEANLLKLTIESQMAANNIVLVSLEGINELSKGFFDASFGKLIREYGENLFSMYVMILRPWVVKESLPHWGWNSWSTFRAAA